MLISYTLYLLPLTWPPDPPNDGCWEALCLSQVAAQVTAHLAGILSGWHG